MTSSGMEAGIEAKQMLRDSYDTYIDSYINAYGEAPPVEELQKFEKSSRGKLGYFFLR